MFLIWKPLPDCMDRIKIGANKSSFTLCSTHALSRMVVFKLKNMISSVWFPLPLLSQDHAKAGRKIMKNWLKGIVGWGGLKRELQINANLGSGRVVQYLHAQLVLFIITMSATEEQICPLCLEEMDATDKHFRPCSCGYQVWWLWVGCSACASCFGSELLYFLL